MITIPVAGDHRSGLGMDVRDEQRVWADDSNSVENSISAADIYMRDATVDCNRGVT